MTSDAIQQEAVSPAEPGGFTGLRAGWTMTAEDIAGEGDHDLETLADAFEELALDLRHLAEHGCWLGVDGETWPIEAGHVAFALELPIADIGSAPSRQRKPKPTPLNRYLAALNDGNVGLAAEIRAAISDGLLEK